MILRPTPTWRHSRLQHSMLLPLPLLLSLGCIERTPEPTEVPPVPVGVTSPVIMPGPPEPPIKTPVPTPPKTWAPRALFTGRQVSVPPVFEGLEPGMPLLAARVLFPQLPDDDYVAASVPNLKFRILARYGWVDALTIDVQQPGAHPNLNDLAEMATAQWGRAEGAGQPHWFGPGLRAQIVGSMMLFQPWRTAEAFIRDDVPKLRGLLNQPSSRVKEVFEGAKPKKYGFETYLPGFKWTDMIRVQIYVEDDDRVGLIDLTLRNSTDTRALTKVLGAPTPLKNLRRFTIR